MLFLKPFLRLHWNKRFFRLFLQELHFLFDVLDMFLGLEVFWHHPANFLDSLTHFAANHKVRLAGRVVALDFVLFQFLICLGDAEKIGGQFGRARAVEKFAFLDAFLPLYLSK